MSDKYNTFVFDMFKDAPSAEDDRNILLRWGELHAAVGLAGEAGEVLDVLKKVIFVGKPFDRDVLIKELGDVKFYYTALLQQVGITHEEIEEANIAKLQGRHGTSFEDSTFYKPGDIL